MDCHTEPFRFQFRHVTEIYRLIPDAQTPILVPFDERAAKLRDELLSLPDAAADLALRQAIQHRVCNQIAVKLNGARGVADQSKARREESA